MQQHDQPEQVARLIEEFLAEHPAGPTTICIAIRLCRTARWTPPPYPGKRFDTQFFVAAVQHEHHDPSKGVQVDGDEILEHDWMRPADAIGRRDARELDLAPPTFVTLMALSRHDTVASVLAHASAQSAIPHFATRPINHEGGSLLMWFYDDGYTLSPEEAILAAGQRHRLQIGDGPWLYERTTY